MHYNYQTGSYTTFTLSEYVNLMQQRQALEVNVEVNKRSQLHNFSGRDTHRVGHRAAHFVSLPLLGRTYRGAQLPQ